RHAARHPEAADQGQVRGAPPAAGRGRGLMANAKTAELRNLVDDELETRLVETKAELFNLRFRHVTGELPNMTRLKDLRREIARIHTLLREREIAAYEAQE